MTTLTMPLPILGGHPGRHARPGPARRAITITTRVTASAAAAGLLASGLLAAAHPLPQHSQPACVPWHSCSCRYPGAPLRLNGNQLCITQHKSWAPVVAMVRP